MYDPLMQNLDLEPQATALIKTEQLLALTTVITGEGFEHFQSMNDKLQHNLLFLVSALSHEIYQAVRGGSNDEVQHG